MAERINELTFGHNSAAFMYLCLLNYANFDRAFVVREEETFQIKKLRVANIKEVKHVIETSEIPMLQGWVNKMEQNKYTFITTDQSKPYITTVNPTDGKVTSMQINSHTEPSEDREVLIFDFEQALAIEKVNEMITRLNEGKLATEDWLSGKVAKIL